jgi:GTP cyclohydrolase III
MKSTKNLPELFEKLIQFQLAMLQLSFYYGGDNYLGCWLK